MVEKNVFGNAVVDAINDYNLSFNQNWQWGTPWQHVATKIDDFLANQLFPKIAETTLKEQRIGNRFDFTAREVAFIGQLTEEYIVMDTVPTGLNLDNDREQIYRRQYPLIADQVYGAGDMKKVKFTLNNNRERHNFTTLGDAITYVTQVYRNATNAFNLLEEKEIKALLIDYAMTKIDKDNPAQYRTVTNYEDLAQSLSLGMLNLQNNSDAYNEADKIVSFGRHTTHTKMDDMLIVTSDKAKNFLLNSTIANTFQIAGLDITDHIISFDNLGGVYRLTDDVKPDSLETKQMLDVYGQYNVGEVIPKGRIFTFDLSQMPEFKGKYEEIKPKSDLFAMLIDINALRYNRFTKGMLKQPMYNNETDEYDYTMIMYSQKAMSPFYNKIVFAEA